MAAFEEGAGDSTALASEGMVQHRSSDRTSFVNFTLEGTQGERRRHRYLFEENEVMSALFDTTTSSFIKSQPAQLSMLLNHLSSTEASFSVSTNMLKVCSFNEEPLIQDKSKKEKENKVKVSTEVTLPMAEFDEVHLSIPTDGDGDDEDAQQISQSYEGLEI